MENTVPKNTLERSNQGWKILAGILACIPAALGFGFVKGMLHLWGVNNSWIIFWVPAFLSYGCIFRPVYHWLLGLFSGAKAADSKSPKKTSTLEKIKENASPVENRSESPINIASPPMPMEPAPSRAAAGESTEEISAPEMSQEKIFGAGESLAPPRTGTSPQPGVFQGLNRKHFLVLAGVIIFVVIYGVMSSFTNTMHQRTVAQLDSPSSGKKRVISKQYSQEIPATERRSPTSRRASYSAAQTASKEMNANLTREFFPGNHGRTQGLDFSLSYPQSWKQVPGEGTQDLAKFASDGGQGHESLVLSVIPAPAEAPQTLTEDVKKELFQASVRKLTEKYNDASSRSVNLAGQEGLAVTHDAFERKDGLIVYMKVTDYFLLVDRKTIRIQARVESLRKGSDLDDRFQRFAPLFDNIAQSLALNSPALPAGEGKTATSGTASAPASAPDAQKIVIDPSQRFNTTYQTGARWKVKYRLDYPQGWKQEAGYGPSVLKFVSQLGRGNESILVKVKSGSGPAGVLRGINANAKARKYFFAGFVQEAEQRHEQVSSRFLKLAGGEGLAISYSHTYFGDQRKKYLEYFVIVDDCVVLIQCKVDAPSLNNDVLELEARFKLLTPVFEHIAQSFTPLG